MKVILHADDFGFDKDTLNATIECFERGALSSCSIMVNCEASEEAFEYAKAHPEFSCGVHLTYVDELIPVCPATEIPSLVNDRGLFLLSNTTRKKAMLHKLSKAEIIAESQAQIDKAEKAGINLSHIDSHGHLHKFPSVLYAISSLKVGEETVHRVRAVQNVFVEKPSWKSPVFWINKYSKWYLKKHFCNPQYFYMSANNMDTGWADNILAQMDKFPQDAVIEIGVHPGHDDEWRQREFDDIIEFACKLQKTAKHQIVNWDNI